MKAIEKIKKLQQELSDYVIERDEQVEALLACLVSGNHMLLLGPPGTAKSMLADSLCQQIEGGKYFPRLLTKFSVPEEVFGPVSMKGIKNDEYRRVVTNTLVDAHVGVLDEVFKSNSAMLNSLLMALNERKFHNGKDIIDMPLLTCVGASNELPQGEELGALYDRFLVRFWVKYIENDDSFIDMIDPNGTIGKNKPTTMLSMDDIAELTEAAAKVTVSQEILRNIRTICNDLRLVGINASDRRWKSAVGMLRAFALLRGNQKVTNDELEMLANMMWDQPEDSKKIMDVVAPYANPLNLKAVEYLDNAKEVYQNWRKDANDDHDDKKAFQANGMLKEILANLAQETNGSEPEAKTKKLFAARDTISEWREEVVKAIGV